jgi:transposase
MKTKTHFAFRVDIWDDTGDSIVEHVAGVDDFEVAVLVEPLLVVRQVLREQVGILHRRLLAIVRDDDVCRRLMTVPGVGHVVG